MNIRFLYKHNGLISPYAPRSNEADTDWNVVPYGKLIGGEVCGLEYGRDYDFQRPFFQQVKELQRVAPRWNLVTYQCENCDWCINCAYCKDSYLLRGSIEARECYYCDKVQRCTETVDCLNISDSELCYELIDASHCFDVVWSQDVEGCQESLFLYDCRACTRCIACVGLSHKDYYFLNRATTVEEFARLNSQIRSDADFRNEVEQQWEQLKREYLHPAVRIIQSEGCVGDRLWNCRNVYWGFSLKNAIDCSYSHLGTAARDCFDCSQPDEMELCYEVASAYKTYNSKFCFNVLEVRDSDYCETSSVVSDCFGCVGLHRKSFCILNKQYSKEDYDDLRLRIIQQMQQTGEWGEFFPVSNSPYCYNETVAQEFYPLTEAECLAKGYRWREDKREDSAGSENLVRCALSGKFFKLQPPELEFYRKMNLPLPQCHPDARHFRRRGKTNPLSLRPARCALTDNSILTSVPGSRGWGVIGAEEHLHRLG